MSMVANQLSLVTLEPFQAIDPLKETEKAYLAGLIDGEGCIGINKSGPKQYKLYIQITVCDQDLNIYWQRRTGRGGIYDGRKYTEKNPKWRPTFTWKINSNDAYELLEEIYPYLLIKREQADIALEFQKLFNATRGQTSNPERLHQFERYKQALSRLKNHLRANEYGGSNDPRS